MWTHLHPYLRTGLTSSFITKDARVTLYRALNLRRLIALTGSGATNAFGFPHWQDLAVLFAEETDRQIKQSLTTRPLPLSSGERAVERDLLHQAIGPLIDELHRLCGKAAAPGTAPADRFTISIDPNKLRKMTDTTLVMDLCEKILEQVPDDFESGKSRLFQARDQFAQHFRKPEADLARLRLERIGEGPSREELEAHNTSIAKKKAEDPVARHLLKRGAEIGVHQAALLGVLDGFAERHDGRRTPALLKQRKAGDRLNRVLCALKLLEREEDRKEPTFAETYAKALEDEDRAVPRLPGAKPFGPTIPAGDGDRDIVATLLGRLGISRVATLNYDVQCEREALRRLTAPIDDNADVFLDLCKDYRTPREKVRRVLVESGLRKGAVSVTLGPDNIGEIVNFAAFSRRYEWQILHLHGRFDDPANMVVTKPDYLRLYMKEGVPREVFREAQETLFGGNDVLLLGIGMSEEDVLRPFRRFVAREDGVTNPGRKVLLMRPAHCCDACELGSNCEACARNDAELVVRHFVNYKVHTILFGGPAYRFVCSRLTALIDVADGLDASPRQRSGPRKTFAAAFDALDSYRAALETRSPEDRPLPDLLSREEIDILRGPAGDATRRFDQIADCAVSRVCFRNLLDDFRGRVMSRALCAELGSLNEERKTWWDAWRQPPHERRALYHMADREMAGQERYLWIRHCPVISYGAEGIDEKFELLAKARDEATRIRRQHEADRLRTHHARLVERHDDAVAPHEFAEARATWDIGLDPGPLRRILRLSIPRGGGKGTFVRLVARKEVQEFLFAGPDGRDQGPGYAAAFVAHMSFSIEFSSVARALTRFFARQAVVLKLSRLDRQEGVKQGLVATAHELYRILHHALGDGGPEETVPDHLRRRLLQDFAMAEAPAAEAILQRITLRDLSDPVRAEVPEGPLFDLAELLYTSRREDQPRLLAQESCARAAELGTEPERPHRLEVLREAMLDFETEARAYEAETERLKEEGQATDDRLPTRVFVCLSGLDRICDRDGDGLNPMHRALFRLITGTTGGGERDPEPPMDLLLVSGSPDVPIAFLSEEHDPGIPVSPESEKLFSRTSKTRRMLRKWPRLEPFAWAHRMLILHNDPVGFGDSDSAEAVVTQARDIFETWAERSGDSFRSPNVHERYSSAAISRALWRNLSLTAAVLAAWCERAEYRWANRARQGEDDEQALRDFLETDFRRFIETLDAAVSRDAVPGVMGAVMSVYQEIDKSRESSGPGRLESGDKRLDRDIVDLVLRHLVFFALPVEPWVLMDCPRIHRRLVQLRVKTDDAPPDTAAERTEALLTERAWMLDYLSGVLERLCARSLLIGVRSTTSNGSGAPGLDRRYALHARLREFLAHKMKLRVADDGDLNHHQISIYCNQPMDLPTPSEEHFKLIRELVDHQIDRCRDSLECAYRYSTAGILYERQQWDPEPRRTPGESEAEIATRAARHIFEPDPDIAGDTAGTKNRFGELHAVSQRLRACFSVVRSAFSVGSLSRLDHLDTSEEDLPFEIYRGWLRGLLNAATGLERNRLELELILGGATFPEPGHRAYKAKFDDLLAAAIAEKHAGDGAREAERDLDDALAGLGLGLNDTVARVRDARSRDEVEEKTDRVSADPAHMAHMVRLAKSMAEIAKQARKLGLTRRQQTDIARLRHPYYRDEIAWLYNERALTSLIQGRIYDAIPLFRQALSVMRHRQAPEFDRRAFHAAERRINLNLSIASIERGRVSIARRMLEDLSRSLEHIKGSTPSKVHLFANAYLALCDHLGGSFDRAEKGYLSAIKTFSAARDLRASSIFNRHFGNLLRHKKDYDRARQYLRLAVNDASQAEQRDVQNFAILSEAALLIEMDEIRTAQGYLVRVAGYARRLGLYGLQADVLLTDCRLKIKRGEQGLAAESAAQAIALSARHGMRLRKISGLVSYGRIQAHRGQLDLAANTLNEAKSEAENLGYQLQAAVASDLLAELDLGSTARGLA